MATAQHCSLPSGLVERLAEPARESTVVNERATNANITSIAPNVKTWLVELLHTIHDYDFNNSDQKQQETISKSVYSLESDPDIDHFEFHKYFNTSSEDESVVSDAKDTDVFSNAFDEILSSLGNEIYQLDSFHQRYFQESKSSVSSEFEQEIMTIFDEFIENNKESVDEKNNNLNRKDDKYDKMELKLPTISKVPSFGNISTLSDDVFLDSKRSSKSELSNIYVNLPLRDENDVVLRSNLNYKAEKHNSFDINRIFDKGKGFKPVPPKRKNRLSNPKLEQTSQLKPIPLPRNIIFTNVDQLKSDQRSRSSIKVLRMKDKGDTSDSGNTSPLCEYSDYQNLWNCTTGRDGATILTPGIIENYGSVNTIRYESLQDIPRLEDSSVKEIAVGGARSDCLGSKSGREGVPSDWRLSGNGLKKSNQSHSQRHGLASCTSECDSLDECHRFLSKAMRAKTKNDSSEVIRDSFGKIKFTEVDCLSDCSSMCDSELWNSGVDLGSDCDSWRTPLRNHSASTCGGSDSPIYENLREVRARAVPPPVVPVAVKLVPLDVMAWKAMLLDSYYNDDEEDEWISSDESLLYSQDRQPPYIIPRIKSHRPPPLVTTSAAPARKTERPQREPEHDREPASPSIKEVRRMFEERGFGRTQGSPKLPRVNHKYDEPLSTYYEELPAGVELRGQEESAAARFNRAKSALVGAPGWLGAPPLRVLPKPYDPADHVIHEGPVNRTKLIENGKKVRKNWQNNYLVMTQTSLAFYKDAKACMAARTGGSSAALPEMVVGLSGAVVSPGSLQQTRRPNALVLTAASRQQLILQHDDQLAANQWLDLIVKAINRLPNDYVCPDNASLGQPAAGTPSPTNKHRTRTKSSSKDEPVFGRLLEQVCPETNPRVPEFVTRCVKAIEATEENMTTDGLYRASGNLSQVQKIRLEVDQNNLSVLDKEVDVHVLTGALKLFFRELKEPVIPCKLFKRALDASAIRVHETKIKEFREIIHSMPDCNRQTLKYLFEHLLRVTSHKEKNRMHIANLSIVLGQTLLWAPIETAHNMAFECLQQNQVIETLLTDFDKIFKEEGRRK